jgi:hypothetical protein
MVATAWDWRAGDNVILYPELEHRIIFTRGQFAAPRRGPRVPARAGAIPAGGHAGSGGRAHRVITTSSVTFAPDSELISTYWGPPRARVPFVVDAAQSVGVLATDVRRSCIDARRVDAKGLLGSTDVVLYCRREWRNGCSPSTWPGLA